MVDIEGIENAVTGIVSDAKQYVANNIPTVIGSAVVGSALIGTGVAVAVANKKKSSKTTKRKTKKRKSKSRKTYKYARTAGKGKDTSHKRIRMTKSGQPYIILASGKARFISKRSARLSRKRKGGRY